MRQLGDEELERLLADAWRAGWAAAVQDFARCCGSASTRRRRRRRRWLAVAVKLLRGG